MKKRHSIPRIPRTRLRRASLLVPTLERDRTMVTSIWVNSTLVALRRDAYAPMRVMTDEQVDADLKLSTGGSR